MPTDDLNLGIQKPFLGKIRENLVPKQMRVYPLLDTRFYGVPLVLLFRKLPRSPGTGSSFLLRPDVEP